ncbi:MAG TPA: leucine zipper domain-containing protein [Gaiellaceae bacterium]
MTIAAAIVGCSRQTGSKWVNRHRRGEGLEDRSSGPHHSPRRASDVVERAVRAARAELQAGRDRGGGAGERDLGEHNPEGAARAGRAGGAAGGAGASSGGGPKRLADSDPTLLADLGRLLDGETRGDPGRPLLWTSKSVRKLAGELRGLGHEVSYRTVARLLHQLGYSLQANGGTPAPRPRRTVSHIGERVAAALAAQEPVISVDTKKKELVGEYKNGGREWQRKGKPVAVKVHNFPDKALGKAIPFGVYDIGANQGFVNVGITSETEPACGSRSATSRPGRASGTRSSIASGASSPRTGAAGRWSATR